MNFFKKRPLVTLGLLILALVALPTTVYFIQQRSEVRSRAEKTVVLSFSPTSSQANPIQVAPNSPVSLDMMIDPGNNAVSFVKVEVKYDPNLFSVNTSNAFQLNTTAFPQLIEGPVYGNGVITFSTSIGPDPTKVVQTLTKIGTIIFTPIVSTSSAATLISYGSNSLALSTSANSSPAENVIANTIPATLIVGSLITATPTQSPATPTQSGPTLTSTQATPTSISTPTPLPTNTPTPTNVPTATPTPTPVLTSLSLHVLLHGIGSSGDNANPTASSLSNKSPLHLTRNSQVFIYDASNLLVDSANGTITYSAANGNYIGTVHVQTFLPSGFYTLRVQVGQHLVRLVPGIQNLVAGQLNDSPTITLVAGDVNDDNQLNILDYNTIIDCYSDLASPVACTDQIKKDSADITDDGAVNQFDYNLFLREISTQPGQ